MISPASSPSIPPSGDLSASPGRDILFLLRPDFADPAAGAGRFYCPGCATVAGLLTFYPDLRSVLKVREVAFPRPRPEVAALLGTDHPGCPVLVLGSDTSVPEGVVPGTASNGRRYVVGAADIGHYLAVAYGVGAAHP